MWRSMIETFETSDASRPEALIETVQVYLGVALILLGVVLTGVTVERVMSLHFSAPSPSLQGRAPDRMFHWEPEVGRYPPEASFVV
jgi:hypothetical protein